MKRKHELRDFLILWSTQSISQLGSSITAFALTLWLYEQTGSSLGTATLTICSYAPYVIMSIFAGALTDRFDKKKTMLVCEGLLYTLGAALAALALSVVFSPLTAKALESMFWFFSYKFTVLPIRIIVPRFTILGIILPLITYKVTAKKSIVERLRETE